MLHNDVLRGWDSEDFILDKLLQNITIKKLNSSITTSKFANFKLNSDLLKASGTLKVSVGIRRVFLVPFL
jgi:hypothetical protein